MKNLQISIVIPCYNEERNLRLGALEKVANYMQKQPYDWEVIIVDDGSIDESKRLISKFIKEQPKFVLLENEHKGKAVAVETGMRASKGEYVLFTDMDQATPIVELEKLRVWMKKGFDVVIGSRSSVRKGAPFFRLAMARGFMTLRNIFLQLGIEDTQCGFKLFKRGVINHIFDKMMLYSSKHKVSGSSVTAGFDVELLYVVKRLQYKIKEVPVEWHYQETRHVNFISDSIFGLKDLFTIKMNSLKGLYD